MVQFLEDTEPDAPRAHHSWYQHCSPIADGLPGAPIVDTQAVFLWLSIESRHYFDPIIWMSKDYRKSFRPTVIIGVMDNKIDKNTAIADGINDFSGENRENISAYFFPSADFWLLSANDA